MNVSYPALEGCSFKDEFEFEDLLQFSTEGITSDPKDYYFSVEENEEGDLYAIVTPKKLWDNSQVLSSSGYVVEILKDKGYLARYDDLMECMIESADFNHEFEIRNDLIGQGFEENTEILEIWTMPPLDSPANLPQLPW
jgi:hypothetical protein